MYLLFTKHDMTTEKNNNQGFLV